MSKYTERDMSMAKEKLKMDSAQIAQIMGTVGSPLIVISELLKNAVDASAENIDIYYDFRYEPKVKSLAVAEIFRYCKGFRLSYSCFCFLDQKYKRGVFETVFSQKVRLIPRNKRKDWQKYKLSDFATRVTRKNGGQSDIPLTISAQYGLIDQRDFFSKTVASADMSGYYLLRSGEYAYNRSTSNDYPFGSIKRLELYPMGAVSTLYLCFRVKDDIVLSDLAKWYFESSQWHRGVNVNSGA